MSDSASDNFAKSKTKKRLSARQFIHCWREAGKITSVWEVTGTDDPEELKKGFVNVMKVYLGKVGPYAGGISALEIEQRIDDYSRKINRSRAAGRTYAHPPKYPKRRKYTAVAAVENRSQDLDKLTANIDLLEALTPKKETKSSDKVEPNVRDVFEELMNS